MELKTIMEDFFEGLAARWCRLRHRRHHDRLRIQRTGRMDCWCKRCGREWEED